MDTATVTRLWVETPGFRHTIETHVTQQDIIGCQQQTTREASTYKMIPKPGVISYRQMLDEEPRGRACAPERQVGG